MNVGLRNRQRKHKVDSQSLRRAAELVLEELDHRDALLDITLLSDPPMRNLNRDYRGVDASTDVLSFAQLEGEPTPVGTPGAPIVLGDVVLSVETAARQAGLHTAPGATEADSLHRELVFLLVHGVLHLLGHTHDEVPEREAMEAETERLWNLALAASAAAGAETS